MVNKNCFVCGSEKPGVLYGPRMYCEPCWGFYRHDRFDDKNRRRAAVMATRKKKQ